MTITEDIQAAIRKVPAAAWTPAYDGDGQVRDGAWVADITGLLDLASWPAGMRVIVRKERPHPGAQLRFTDIGGHRFTAFATDTKRGQLADSGAAAPAAGPVRGPHPRRQGHRAAEPAAEGFRAEPDLVRDRRPGLRAAGLDPDARPDRDRPPLGTQAPAAAALRLAGRLASSGRRLRLRLAERWPWAARSPPRSPACRPSHPADQPEQPHARKEKSTRARGTPPTRRDSRAARHGQTMKTAQGQPLRPPPHRRERSRLRAPRQP